jgi:hypothetical protein
MVVNSIVSLRRKPPDLFYKVVVVEYTTQRSRTGGKRTARIVVCHW